MARHQILDREKKALIILGVCSFIIFILMIFCWQNINFLSNFNKILSGIILFIILVLTLVSFISMIVPVGYILAIIYAEYLDKKALKNAIDNLSDTYSEVEIKLKDVNLTGIISKDEIRCFAKLDEDNNIVYKIQIDVEKTTANYIKFMKCFRVSTNSEEM